MTLPALHFGITPWQLEGSQTADDWCRQAELAELWGYQSFWLPESHFTGQQCLPDPLLILAAIAGRTRHIKLATTSYLLPIRHPLQAAEQVAVLDQLCSGRLILGLGRGFRAGMLEAFGVTSRDKRSRFGEVLAAMQAAWSGAAIDAGNGEQILAPLPLQQPHPPLWVAAFGPKALAQAAGLGLPYLASPMESWEELAQNFALYRDIIATAGKPVPEEVAVMRSVFISSDAQRCQHVAKALGNSALYKADNAQPVDVLSRCLLGNVEQVAAQIARQQRLLGLNHLIAVRPRVPGIPDDWVQQSMQEFAALIGQL